MIPNLEVIYKFNTEITSSLLKNYSPEKYKLNKIKRNSPNNIFSKRKNEIINYKSANNIIYINNI